MPTEATQPPAAHAHGTPDCPHCLVRPGGSGSAKVAWTIAIIAVILLVGVFFYGVGSTGGTLLGFGGLALLAILACPLVMGGMMWFMMRHQK
jgi:predicted phage tail protein